MASGEFIGEKIEVEKDLPKSQLKHVRPMRGRFTHKRVEALLKSIYGEEEYKKMHEAGVDRRMMFGTNPHYQALVMGEELQDVDGKILVPKMPPSKAVGALILPRLDEAQDMAGEKDTSNQMAYSPGNAHGQLLHKYGEIVLAYASPTCSAHCRYCYRLDLFNKDTGKSSVRAEDLRDYVVNYNRVIEQTGGMDPKTGEKRYPVKEILLSGGDPLVLTNYSLYRYLVAAGQAGVNMLRIGSKELAFRPRRIDDAFVDMLKRVHARFPDMHINIVSHLTHPDEFLLRRSNGEYVPNESGSGYRWLEESFEAVTRLTSLPFVSVENQTPIIKGVNDDVESIHLLHEEVRRMGIKPKYLFQGREIEGHKAFSLPVEKAWHIHNEAMKGLSDTARSRFAMSTEWGKMEIVSVIDPIGTSEAELGSLPPAMASLFEGLFGDGLIVFRSHRSPYAAGEQGDLIIARRNPNALWISGYEDRILYDTRRAAGEKYAGMMALLTGAFPQLQTLGGMNMPAQMDTHEMASAA